MRIKLLLLLILLLAVGGVLGFYYLTRAPELTSVNTTNTTVQNLPIDTSPVGGPVSAAPEETVELEMDALEKVEFGTNVGDL